jgi:5-methylcytosine-specific restriction endonuclease McrA
MRIVTCAGCLTKFSTKKIEKYRKKVWCGSEVCKQHIDSKIKHKNYKIKVKKINKGTYRNGVNPGLRKDILIRDNHTCRMCFSYHYDDGHSNMQVHHITPVSYGGDDSCINLITLCHSCHKEVHQIGWEVFCESLEKISQELEREAKAG